MRLEMPAAEVKKAEGASWTPLRTPTPPHLTGSVACVQVRSFSWKLTLTMLLKWMVRGHHSRSNRMRESMVRYAVYASS